MKQANQIQLLINERDLIRFLYAYFLLIVTLNHFPSDVIRMVMAFDINMKFTRKQNQTDFVSVPCGMFLFVILYGFVTWQSRIKNLFFPRIAFRYPYRYSITVLNLIE